MERPVRVVPLAVVVLLALALTAQIALRTLQGRIVPEREDLPTAPRVPILRLAGFGDPIPVAKVLMLYVQSFDLRGDNLAPYQRLDYVRLIGWLGAILELDPVGQYPLMSASRIYAAVPDKEKQRQMLDFVYREFLKDPGRRWPWLAEAALLARHELGDLPLARLYAAAIQKFAKGPNVPLWARQMEAFILEDMNQLEAAAIMIGGLIDSGMVQSPGELALLKQRLADIRERLRTEK